MDIGAAVSSDKCVAANIRANIIEEVPGFKQDREQLGYTGLINTVSDCLPLNELAWIRNKDV
jgi:hypothetical protein